MTTTPSDRRYRKETILAAIDALILEAPNSKDIEGETKRIILPANPGQFTLFNSKEALRNARDLIHKQESIGNFPQNTRPKILYPKRHRAPKLGEFDVNVLKVVTSFVASWHDYREELKQIRADGQTLTATSGKIWIRVEGDFPGAKTKPVFLDPNGKKEVERQGKFPSISFSPSEEFSVLERASTSNLFTQLCIIQGFLKGSDFDKVSIFANADHSFGLSVMGDPTEMIEINLDPLNTSTQYVNTFDPVLLLRMLKGLRLLGFQEFDVSISDRGPTKEQDSDALVFRAPKVTMVVMPAPLKGYQPMGRPE